MSLSIVEEQKLFKEADCLAERNEKLLELLRREGTISPSLQPQALEAEVKANLTRILQIHKMLE